MSLRRSLAAAFGAAVVLSLASAAQAGPWGLAPGEFYTELSGGFFSTDTYLDANGDRIGIGAEFEERAATAHTEFGWKKRATFIMEVPFVARMVAPQFQGSPTFSYTGLGDIQLGLRYAIAKGSLPMTLELGWSAPLGTNRNLFPGASGSGGVDPTQWPVQAFFPLYMDSSVFFSTGLQSLSLRYDIGGGAGDKVFWAAGVGSRYRYLSVSGSSYTKDASGTETIHGSRWATFNEASATLGVWLSKEMLLTGDVRGQWSGSQGDGYDRLSGTPGNPDFVPGPKLDVKEVLVGPRFTYRVDDRMDVFAGSWHTASGENVLHQNRYFIGIAWKNTSLDRLAGPLGGTKAPSRAPAAKPAAPAATTPPASTTPKK